MCERITDMLTYRISFLKIPKGIIKLPDVNVKFPQQNECGNYVAWIL